MQHRPAAPGRRQALRLLTVAPLSRAAAAQTRLVYGADRAFAPFEYRDDAGRAQGFQIDLLRALERSGDLKFEVRQDGWDTIEAGFRAGRIDVLAMSATPARRQWALFTRAHATPATGIYHRRDTRAPVALDDLAGGVIAMVEQGEAARHTREAFLADREFRFLLLPDVPSIIAAVRDGRATYAVTARAYGDAVIAQPDNRDVVASDFSPRLQAYGFAVAPGNEALRARIDTLLAQLEADGTLESLRRKWLSSHHDAAVQSGLEQRLRREQAALGALALLSVAGGWWLTARLRSRRRAVRAERSRREDAERALATARRRLDRAFTQNPDAMLITGTGRVIEANLAFARMFGRDSGDLTGRALDELPPFARSGVVDTVRELLAAQGYFENLPFDLVREDGSRAWFLVSGRRIETGGEPEVFSIVREVSAELDGDAGLREEFDALIASWREQKAELARTREKARESEEALQGFTESISHDLRAPLRAIGGFSGLLRGSLAEGDLEAAVESARLIENAALRMGSMLEGLTRLSRIGRTPLERVEIDMAAEAQAVWQLITAADTARQVGLRIGPLPSALADRALVGQVWQNVLDNAWKFTARSAEPLVAIDAHIEDGVTWYRVTDNGAGFDMRYAQHLFQPFRRMHAQSEFGGTGVGLSVVRRIAQAHGGQARARSSPGVGTVIEFCLEAGPAPE